MAIIISGGKNKKASGARVLFWVVSGYYRIFRDFPFMTTKQKFCDVVTVIVPRDEFVILTAINQRFLAYSGTFRLGKHRMRRLAKAE